MHAGRTTTRSPAQKSPLVFIAILALSVFCDAQVLFRLPIQNNTLNHTYFDHNGFDWNCGTQTYRTHHGTDFPAPAGTEIFAAASGILINKINHVDDSPCAFDGDDCPGCTSPNGNHVRIHHGFDADGNSIQSVYLHMKKGTVTAKDIGEIVVCGDPIGKIGRSGCVDVDESQGRYGYHLHFEIQLVTPSGNTIKVDPYTGQCNPVPSRWVNQIEDQPSTSCSLAISFGGKVRAGASGTGVPGATVHWGDLSTKSIDGEGEAKGAYWFNSVPSCQAQPLWASHPAYGSSVPYSYAPPCNQSGLALLDCPGGICSPAVISAANFAVGNVVEVFNTGGVGLRAWETASNCTPPNGYMVKPEGRTGVILSNPPQCCGGFTRWKIKWNDDQSERWSAEGDPNTGDMWLRIVGTSSDTTLPTVAITSPTNGQTASITPFTVTGVAADPGSPASGVSFVQVRYGSGNWQPATGTVNWSYSLSLAQGTNQIEARSADVAGNYSTPASVSITFSPSTAQIMEVSPTNGFDAEGNYGGPFSPNTKTFTIFNNSNVGLAYSYAHNAPWLSNNSTSPVVLNPNSSHDVRFDLTPAANTLLPGIYATSIEFKDLTNITTAFRQMTLKVNPTIPVITQHPGSLTVPVGTSAQMRVFAVGAAQLSYQWRKGTSPISDGNGISGTNTPTLTFSPVSESHAGSYDVRVTNSYTTSTSTPGTLAITPDLGPCFGSWTQATTTGPAPRFQTSMAFDAERQLSVLFGGLTLNSAGTSVFLGDTWTWSGQAWNLAAAAQSSDCNNQVGTPCARSSAAIAYSPSQQRVLLFGGYRWDASIGSRWLSDFWHWDGGVWTRQFPATTPPGRAMAAMSTAMLGRAYLHGGQGESKLLGDLWQWDGANWYAIPVSSGPSPRYGHAIAYDISRSRLVLFGGLDSSGRRGDTWEWDGSNWHLVSTTGPAPRYGHGMVYTAASAIPRIVLHGGNTANTAVSDTWEWDGTKWSQVTSVIGQPAIRTDAGVAYDSTRDHIVLFGGWSPIYGDTWLLRRPTQQEAQITHQPASTIVSAGQSVVLNMTATGSAPLTYQWRRNGVPLVEGQRVVGSLTNALLISPALAADTGTYDATVTGPCGTITTDAAFVNVVAPACGGADFNSDQSVNTSDLVFFLGRFGQPATPGSQAERADFNFDGVVNTSDLTFFLGRFGSVCPS